MSDLATVFMQEYKRSKRREQQTVPEPFTDVESLRATVIALKELVETLAGQRGTPLQAAVTWQDMLNLQIVNKAGVPQDLGSNTIQP